MLSTIIQFLLLLSLVGIARGSPVPKIADVDFDQPKTREEGEYNFGQPNPAPPAPRRELLFTTPRTTTGFQLRTTPFTRATTTAQPWRTVPTRATRPPTPTTPYRSTTQAPQPAARFCRALHAETDSRPHPDTDPRCKMTIPGKPSDDRSCYCIYTVAERDSTGCPRLFFTRCSKVG